VGAITAKGRDGRRNNRGAAGAKVSASKAKDDADAGRWYRKAAEGGRAEAQNNLGLLYVLGRGVPKDDAEAMKWFGRAAAQGYSPAQTTLAELRRQGRGGKS